MVQQLGNEVPDVEAKHFALPHRNVAARGCVQIAVVTQANLADRTQTTADVGVLAVELD